MKTTHVLSLACLCVSLSKLSGQATDRFVSLAGSNQSPYATWATAATNIQDAIDAAFPGETVWVTNGLYASGGKIIAGDLLNRVALDKPITLKSVNGPFTTTIQGTDIPLEFGSAQAVRCAWLTNGATLFGFTLQYGGTRAFGDQQTLQSGGGVWCQSSNAVVSNCRIQSNSAAWHGSGGFRGSFKNCFMTRNIVELCDYASTVEGAVLGNCTVAYNVNVPATFANRGAVSQCWVTNSIVYFNGSGNCYACSIYYSCATDVSGTPVGPGVISVDPLLLSDRVHLAANSPCRATGLAAAAGGTDLFGRPWANPPAMGCAEVPPAPLIVTQPTLQFTNGAAFTVTMDATGNPPLAYRWNRSGVPLENDGHYSSAHTNRLAADLVRWQDAGNYQVVVSNGYGMATSAVAPLVIHCVAPAAAQSSTPYLDWRTAATNIQDAINAALPNEVVLVTNGIYASGGISKAGTLTNRVTLDKPLLVKSINGPQDTFIQGNWDPATTNGNLAVRCAWLTNQATLYGFALQGGATANSGDNGQLQSGGGVWCLSSNAFVFNCILRSNTANFFGGGAYNGTLQNCFLTANRTIYLLGNGAGACNAILKSCTVVSNTSAWNDSAVSTCLLTNCIVSFNTPSNYYNCTFYYCCSTPLPNATGCISADPQFLPDGMHLTNTSPCRFAGAPSLVAGVDCTGLPWLATPSMGCVQWQTNPFAYLPPPRLLNNPVGFSLNSAVTGQYPFACGWLKDATPLQDDGHYSGAHTATLQTSSIGWSDAGNYQIIVTNAYGVTTSAVSRLVIHCVSPLCTTPSPPYITWATATPVLQDAVTAAAAGEVVLVTNGLYATGGKAVDGDLTNRVAVDKPLLVQSLKGPLSTIIQGAWDPTTTNGPQAVRCAWLTSGAILNGFHLQGGATRNWVDDYTQQSGGGVRAASNSSVVLNCILTSNSAYLYGGGSYEATLRNCALKENTANQGGGAYGGLFFNCTITGNHASDGGGICNPLEAMSVVNCIVYDNTASPGRENFYNYSYATTRFTNSCTFPTPTYRWNLITNPPQLVDGIHLTSTSPCRAAADATQISGLDVDGEPWANPPSMGCDEIWEQSLTGPLSVALSAIPATTAAVKGKCSLTGTVVGRAGRLGWSFGDGTVITNVSSTFWPQYSWTNPGDYTVTFTAFNQDNPAGVSTSLMVHVAPLAAPRLSLHPTAGNALVLTFLAQSGVSYYLQQTTNLAPPISWQTLLRASSLADTTLSLTNYLTPVPATLFRLQIQ